MAIYGDRYAGMGGIRQIIGGREDARFRRQRRRVQPLQERRPPWWIRPTRPSKWGFVTRIANLDKITDSNCPFELYKKDADHFRFEYAVVEWETAPLGIGQVEVIPDTTNTAGRTTGRSAILLDMTGTQGVEILVDPVTGERIDWSRSSTPTASPVDLLNETTDHPRFLVSSSTSSSSGTMRRRSKALRTAPRRRAAAPADAAAAAAMRWNPIRENR